MLGRLIRAREIQHSRRDKNRVIRPFDWGLSFITDHVNGDDPRHLLRRHAQVVLLRSEEFYGLPPIKDYKLSGQKLTWTSAVHTPSAENNTARARFFPARESKEGRASGRKRRAVVLLPQWNAQSDSHVDLCKVLSHLGISALRVTLPYHEARRPPELERADFLVSSNIGRTMQSFRQAVLDARAAVYWLKEQGYDRVGIMGTSVGSCTAFLAFSHDASIDVGVFNHVSGYFADVVWRGISTRHVRDGLREEVTLDELREYWLPISPLPFIKRLTHMPGRPMRFIAARHDLTFPADLTENVIAETRRLGILLNVAWLPCGHYTIGERPWVYMDGWKIVSFFRKHL